MGDLNRIETEKGFLISSSENKWVRLHFAVGQRFPIFLLVAPLCWDELVDACPLHLAVLPLTGSLVPLLLFNQLYYGSAYGTTKNGGPRC